MSLRTAPLLLLAACASMGHSAPPPPPAASLTPASFVRSTADAKVTRTLDVRDGLTHSQAMRVVTDALSQRYTVEVTDPRSGFAMTAWQAPMREGVPDLRYRTRITAKFLGDDWKRLQVRDEANWANGEEWDVGYDVAQLDSVTSDLRAKLGKRP